VHNKQYISSVKSCNAAKEIIFIVNTYLHNKKQYKYRLYSLISQLVTVPNAQLLWCIRSRRHRDGVAISPSRLRSAPESRHPGESVARHPQSTVAPAGNTSSASHFPLWTASPLLTGVPGHRRPRVTTTRWHVVRVERRSQPQRDANPPSEVVITWTSALSVQPVLKEGPATSPRRVRGGRVAHPMNLETPTVSSKWPVVKRQEEKIFARVFHQMWPAARPGILPP